MKKGGKPYQSVLDPHVTEIMDLRQADPPTTFREIARIMKVRHGLEVTLNCVWSFVDRRSKLKRVLKRAQAFKLTAPVIDTSSLLAKIRERSEAETKPKDNKWKKIRDL